MSDIQAGDVVVCADDAPERAFQNVVIRRGAFYRVLQAGLTPLRQRPALDVGKRGRSGRIAWYHVTRFRKIDAADEQFTEQMRQCRPIKTREPVS